MISSRSSGRVLARLAGSVPSAVGAATIREHIATYYASYAAFNVSTRLALFTSDCRFEDPAGHVVATDLPSLRRFFTDEIPATWTIVFRLEQVAVVGDEALATTVMSLRIEDRTPVDVVVAAHFTFAESGLIRTVRTFFDEGTMDDASP